MKNSKILDITLCAAFTAIICLFTMFIQIRIFPTQGGMVHIGNVPLFFVAAFYGKKIGAVSGGLGMFLSDLITGWVTYSVATLIVVAIMGWVFGAIVNEKITLPRLLAAVAAVLGIASSGPIHNTAAIPINFEVFFPALFNTLSKSPEHFADAAITNKANPTSANTNPIRDTIQL